MKKIFAIFFVIIFITCIGYSVVNRDSLYSLAYVSDEIKDPEGHTTGVAPQKTSAGIKTINTPSDRGENKIDNLQDEIDLENGEKVEHVLRKFPFPFEAMLAISSDTDLTTLHEFETYHRFLNTKEQTPWGEGLGLDIADSTWMFVGNNYSDKVDFEGHNPDYSMSYFQGLDSKILKDASSIVHYYKAGWIDSLHTFGDFSIKDNKILFNRDYAVEAVKEMKAQEFLPKVWINHGTETNVQNFGGYDPKRISKYHAGDDKKSPYYHTDITIGNGVRYVWNSLGSNQFELEYPLFPINLRDGRKVWGFQRYTHDVVNGKLVWNWEPHELPRQITPKHLDSMVKGNKYAILAQHFGKGTEEFPFNQKDIEALKLLENYQSENKILVARTERLLNYARVQRFIKYEGFKKDGKVYINIKSIEDPILGTAIPTIEEIHGVTFYVDDPNQTTILLGLKPISEENIQRNQPDRTGRQSIGIQWFKEDYKDYTRNNGDLYDH